MSVYHFGAPCWEVVRVGDYRSFVMADILGIIEGAHMGKGLGHQFSPAYSTRTSMLLFLIEVTSFGPRCRLSDSARRALFL